MLYELGGHDGFRTPLEPGETMADYAVTVSGVEELRPYGMDSRCMLTIGEARFPLERAHPPVPQGLRAGHHCPGPGGGAPGCPGGPLRPGAGGGGVPDFPYLGLWTADKPFDTGYFCIEPGLPSRRGLCGPGPGGQGGHPPAGAGGRPCPDLYHHISVNRKEKIP